MKIQPFTSYKFQKMTRKSDSQDINQAVSMCEEKIKEFLSLPKLQPYLEGDFFTFTRKGTKRMVLTVEVNNEKLNKHVKFNYGMYEEITPFKAIDAVCAYLCHKYKVRNVRYNFVDAFIKTVFLKNK